MKSSIATFLLILGCSDQPLPSTDSGADTQTVEPDDILDDPEPWQAPVESIEDASSLADFMFDLTEVHPVNITMTDEAINSLSADPYT